MAANLFALVEGTCDIYDALVVNELNEEYGGEDDAAMFDWCDLFKGEGGHRLTVEQALAIVKADASSTDPFGHLYFVWVNNEMHEILGGDDHSLIAKHKGPVLFLKARL